MRPETLRCLPMAAVLALSAAPVPAQVSQNVIFHARLDEHSQYNDIWGYTAPNGDEYALVGTAMGVAVVNVVDPKNPYETGFIPGPVSAWRDIKTYSHYAYVTNEANQGLDIIDLDDPENPVGLPNYAGFSTAHNLFIDTATARCYIAGSDVANGGVRILSLANPESPVEVGSWEVAYFHDVMVQDDVLYGSAINVDTLYLLDVSNSASVSVLGSVGNYPNAFTHNAWVTPDGTHVMTTDEVVGAACRMWDVTNPLAITQTDLYVPDPGTIPHNAHIEGDLAFISHYTIGVRIVDVSDPDNLAEVGWYDTWPPDDAGTYRGCWGVFPFFGTNPDLLVASDFNNGLYVLEYKGELGTVAGEITKSGDPGVKVAHAAVQILETGNGGDADADGLYSVDDVPGAVTLEVSAYGYQTQATPAVLVAGSTTTVNVALPALPGGSVSGVVTDALTSLPLGTARVEVPGTPLVPDFDPGTGAYDVPTIPSGTAVVRAHAFGYDAMQAVVTMGPGDAFTADFALGAALVADTFDGGLGGGDGGWSVSGNATGGTWERGDPEQTESYLGVVQPGSDHTEGAGNTDCWVTDRLAGLAVGDHDVDGGSTILTSPSFDVTALESPRVSFWRWYVTGVLFNPTTDTWRVEISDDGGASWTTLETTDLPDPQWLHVDVAIEDFVAATDQVRLRFTAQDLGPNSVVEAAIDDFTIYGIDAVPATSAPEIGTPFPVLSLGPSRPNPVRAGDPTTLSFSLPAAGPVTAAVYDVTGARVATLLDRRVAAGPHELRWDGRGDGGNAVAGGVYFVRLHTIDGARSRKVLVLR